VRLDNPRLRLWKDARLCVASGLASSKGWPLEKTRKAIADVKQAATIAKTVVLVQSITNPSDSDIMVNLLSSLLPAARGFPKRRVKTSLISLVNWRARGQLKQQNALASLEGL
jgi:hypothetical protein